MTNYYYKVFRGMEIFMSNVYVVTGGTSGIGAAIVKKILSSAKTEDKIIVNYGHNDERANAFLASLDSGDQEKVVLLKADLSDYDSMQKFADTIVEKYKKIDYLVCNTGIGTYMKFSEYTFDVWSHVMDTNISIPVFMIKKFMDVFSKDASVLLVGSYAGKRPYSSSVVYSVSKAALVFLAEVLVKELEPLGARINAIAPGFIETDWQKDRTDESRNRVNKKIALHRFGLPEEVADMAYAVMTNQYMNGSVIDIHGGYDYF